MFCGVCGQNNVNFSKSIFKFHRRSIACIYISIKITDYYAMNSIHCRVLHISFGGQNLKLKYIDFIYKLGTCSTFKLTKLIYKMHFEKVMFLVFSSFWQFKSNKNFFFFLLLYGWLMYSVKSLIEIKTKKEYLLLNKRLIYLCLVFGHRLFVQLKNDRMNNKTNQWNHLNFSIRIPMCEHLTSHVIILFRWKR